MLGFRALKHYFALLLVSSLASLLLGVSASAMAQEALSDDGSTRDIDEYYVRYRQQSSGMFRTLPGTHITPHSNRLVFGAMFEHLNIRVKGADQSDPNSPGAVASSDSLRMRGYSLSPYVGFSEKYLGAGLLLEHGEYFTDYRHNIQSYNESSRIKYNGVGGLVFLTPTPDQTNSQVTFILATRMLNADHGAMSTQNVRGLEAYEWENIDYDVVKTHIGGNIKFKLIKQFSLIPWTNVTHTFSRELDEVLADSKNPQQAQTQGRTTVSHVERYSGDRDIFWTPGWSVDYGLDMALAIKDFEFHFGNMITSVMHTDSPASRVDSQIVSVSVIYFTPAK